eukprot:CAMPEP_0202510554 /NCGR_PEP_ID=MMETSP1361-20130828/53356_1 /ASSEMBLY_ACC=CAM_ASM_000849 /TAXON_ID=210615 /ORGANISM="Staurosira complex sp., Strain CCMP2646" /LENGTH=157 /DNA_ID=CAMNT_0049144823 /DNA_START=78 /DNA_END=551 /DNA_ORIENTATION=+
MALPSLASRVSLLSKLSLNRTTPLATLPQVRTQWFQDEVRSHRDPVTGKWRYEEPTMTIQRFRIMKRKKAPREYEKPWMRRRRIADEKIYKSKKKGVNEKAPREYEKPWMRRRRIADEKIYKSKKKGVNELLKYIKFTKEAREARDEEWAFTKTDQD